MCVSVTVYFAWFGVLLLIFHITYVCFITEGCEKQVTQVQSSDVKYNWNDIKRVSEYDDLCVGKYVGICTAFVTVGKGGQLFKSGDFALGAGYIESVMKVTKDGFMGQHRRKIEYLTGAGLWRVHTGDKPENINFKIFGAQASLEGSASHLGNLVSTYNSL